MFLFFRNEVCSEVEQDRNYSVRASWVTNWLDGSLIFGPTHTAAHACTGGIEKLVFWLFCMVVFPCCSCP